VAKGRYRDGDSLAFSRIDALAVGGAGDECARQRASVSAPPICNGNRHELAIAGARHTCTSTTWLYSRKRCSVDAEPAADASSASPGTSTAHGPRPDTRLPPPHRQWLQRWRQRRRRTQAEQLIQPATGRRPLPVQCPSSTGPPSSTDPTTIRRGSHQWRPHRTCTGHDQERGREPQLHGAVPTAEAARRRHGIVSTSSRPA
jgi:hypothetical protein